jgi:hypothetical protein
VKLAIMDRLLVIAGLSPEGSPQRALVQGQVLENHGATTAGSRRAGMDCHVGNPSDQADGDIVCPSGCYCIDQTIVLL